MDGLLEPILDNFRRHFWGPTGCAHAFPLSTSGEATANGRWPHGPVNIGSKCTCVVSVLHCVGFKNRPLDPSMSSFFDVFFASPIHTPFETAFETNFCRNYRFLALNLGANMAKKMVVTLVPPPFFRRFGVRDAFEVPPGPTWPHLGAVLGPTWHHFGAILGPKFGLLGPT